MNRLDVRAEALAISPVAVRPPIGPAVAAAPAATVVGAGPQSVADLIYENRLAEVRLGIASSLFLSLRAKHAPTAAHCLRVALGCSAWSFALELDDQQRDELEVAA